MGLRKSSSDVKKSPSGVARNGKPKAGHRGEGGGAPLGNKFAVGNSGGKPYNRLNRKKAGTLKGLVLDWALKVLRAKLPEGKDEDETRTQLEIDKRMVISKILPTCVSREIDLKSEDGRPLLVINLGGK